MRLLLLSLFLLSLSVLAKTETIVIGKFGDAPALAQCDRVIRLVYRHLKIPIEILNLPGRRSLKLANEGRIDAELCRIAMTETKYTNLIRISPAVFTLDFAALYTTDANITIRHISHLYNLRIGTARGMMAAELILNEDKIKYEASVALIVKLLRDKLVDVIILPTIELQLELDRLGNPSRYQLSPTLYSYPLYHFVHKKHAKLTGELSATLSDVLTHSTSH